MRNNKEENFKDKIEENSKEIQIQRKETIAKEKPKWKVIYF
jgi:hypothetical protein